MEIHEQWDNTQYFEEKEKWKDKPRVLLSNIECSICSKRFKPNRIGRKYCSLNCSRKAKEKISWPAREELQKLINNQSLHSLGKELGVSCNAIRRRCRKLNISWK